jgi:transposase InsO family protein
MLIIGYCHGIRSERRLFEEVHLNLAYRWFCRLGLEGEVPDHSTFSRNRHGRFRESDLLRHVFETVVGRCLAEGLVGGEGFAVNASLIEADANRQEGVEGAKGLPPEMSSRAIEEYLAVLDDAAFGAASEVTPKFLSPADPAARWTAAQGGQAFFAYCTNYLIDLDHAVILDVEASSAVRQAEVTAAKTMIERTEERFDLTPKRLAADTAYGSAEMLGWLVDEHGIAPHVPVFDNSKRRDGTFSRQDFTLNGKLRDELLNGETFYTLKEAQLLIERWRHHYNTVRPHSSLGYRPPAPETILPGPPVPAYAMLRPAQQGPNQRPNLS